MSCFVVVFVGTCVQDKDLQAPEDTKDRAHHLEELDEAELVLVLAEVILTEELLLGSCVACDIDMGRRIRRATHENLRTSNDQFELPPRSHATDALRERQNDLSRNKKAN